MVVMCDASRSPASNGVVIRLATMHDLDDLVGLAVQTHDHHVAGDPHSFEPIAEIAEKRAHFGGWLRDESATVLVALVDDRPVGYAVLRKDVTPRVPGVRQRLVGRVEDIGVDSGHRRRGIGRRLMDEALNWARTAGLEALELNVFEFNTAAIALYESLGYRTSSRRMRLVLSGDEDSRS
jgi:ribosomal protein S18 acetylase RimI-like enzyme